MRTAIDIDDGRVFLCGVEVDRLHHAIEEVGLAVGSLERAAHIFRHVVALPRVS